MSLVPERASIPENPYGVYDTGSREWTQAATIADAMSLTLIRMDRSQVPSLEIQSTAPVVTAFEHQWRALHSVARTLVPAAEVESFVDSLIAGNSAFIYQRTTKSKGKN